MFFLRNHVLPPLIAVFYWLWSRTWRLRILEDPSFIEEKSRNPVAFAHWHGDEMVVLRLGKKYHCAAMTSTSKDGELMTRVLKLFGFGISRGSSTRGGARALVGMVHLVRQGFNATMAVDGPKGPRHRVKPGIWHLSKHAGIRIIPTGVAKSRAITFHKSWNKTFLPLPFAKVVVSFGSPLPIPREIDENMVLNLEAELERRLHLERGRAQAALLGGEKCALPV